MIYFRWNVISSTWISLLRCINFRSSAWWGLVLLNARFLWRFLWVFLLFGYEHHNLSWKRWKNHQFLSYWVSSKSRWSIRHSGASSTNITGCLFSLSNSWEFCQHSVLNWIMKGRPRVDSTSFGEVIWIIVAIFSMFTRCCEHWLTVVIVKGKDYGNSSVWEWKFNFFFRWISMVKFATSDRNGTWVPPVNIK
jgi:hypothetical protein